jgi:hypothetical protein
MIVIDATFSDVTRSRDYGRVEAIVSLLVKTVGRPVRNVSVRTSVSDRGDAPLRHRLIRDAARLALRLGATRTSLTEAA